MDPKLAEMDEDESPSAAGLAWIEEGRSTPQEPIETAFEEFSED